MTKPAQKKKAPAVKAAPAPEPADMKPLGNLTPEEMAIFQRVSSETQDWQTITEDEAIDFSLMNNIFDLPEEAQKMEREKKFAFRWVTRSKERIDQIRTRPVPWKWWLCNHANTPFLKKYIDPIMGGIIREDQILVFRPWWMHEKEQSYKRESASVLDQTKSLDALQGRKKGGLEMETSQRSLEGGRESRLEVKGSDIIMGDEADIDASRGIVHSEMSDSELVVTD